ncbi:MAG: hypothetical protein WBL45_04270 [Solirubrobacterales bacterium]
MAHHRLHVGKRHVGNADGDRPERVAQIVEAHVGIVFRIAREPHRLQHRVPATAHRRVVHRPARFADEDTVPIGGEVLTVAEAVERGGSLIDQRNAPNAVALGHVVHPFDVATAYIDQGVSPADISPSQPAKF